MLYYASDYYSPYISHYGTLGMRWGVRRYQNEDGSLTPAGKKRYEVESKKYTKLANRADKNIQSQDKAYYDTNAKIAGTVATVAAGASGVTRFGYLVAKNTTPEMKTGLTALKLTDHAKYKEIRNTVGTIKKLRSAKIALDKTKNTTNILSIATGAVAVGAGGVYAYNKVRSRMASKNLKDIESGRAAYNLDNQVIKMRNLLGESATDSIMKTYVSEIKKQSVIEHGDDGYLCHYGILGMHWGERRYQNPDGTYTEAGKARYRRQVQREEKKEARAQKRQEHKDAREAKRFTKALTSGDPKLVVKYAPKMTDEELRRAANRVDIVQRVKPKKLTLSEHVVNAINTSAKITKGLADTGDSIKRIKKLFNDGNKDEDEKPEGYNELVKSGSKRAKDIAEDVYKNTSGTMEERAAAAARAERDYMTVVRETAKETTAQYKKRVERENKDRQRQLQRDMKRLNKRSASDNPLARRVQDISVSYGGRRVQ